VPPSIGKQPSNESRFSRGDGRRGVCRRRRRSPCRRHDARDRRLQTLVSRRRVVVSKLAKFLREHELRLALLWRRLAHVAPRIPAAHRVAADHVRLSPDAALPPVEVRRLEEPPLRTPKMRLLRSPSAYGSSSCLHNLQAARLTSRVSAAGEGWRGGCRERSEPPCSYRDTQARRLHTLVRRAADRDCGDAPLDCAAEHRASAPSPTPVASLRAWPEEWTPVHLPAAALSPVR